MQPQHSRQRRAPSLTLMGPSDTLLQYESGHEVYLSCCLSLTYRACLAGVGGGGLPQNWTLEGTVHHASRGAGRYFSEAPGIYGLPDMRGWAMFHLHTVVPPYHPPPLPLRSTDFVLPVARRGTLQKKVRLGRVIIRPTTETKNRGITASLALHYDCTAHVGTDKKNNNINNNLPR